MGNIYGKVCGSDADIYYLKLFFYISALQKCFYIQNNLKENWFHTNLLISCVFVKKREFSWQLEQSIIANG